MVNGLGVVGWGVGGIEAEAAMLGQPISMLIPPVLGFRLTGAMLEGATATDLVLTITERLRKHGVVGKFVEFFGPGLAHLTIADRATLGNMCPEYGATVAIFPIDDMTLDYLRLTGRDESQVALVEAYAKAQGLFRTAGDPDADLHRDDRARSRRPSSRASPGRAGRRIACRSSRRRAASRRRSPSLKAVGEEGARPSARRTRRRRPAARRRPSPRCRRSRPQLDHGSVVIAAITSCTNTSNPSVMIGAGLRREEGGRARPDAQAVGEDQPRARLEGRDRVSARRRASTPYLDQLGFNLVGYGCTTCIGNSGPLPDDVSRGGRRARISSSPRC